VELHSIFISKTITGIGFFLLFFVACALMEMKWIQNELASVCQPVPITQKLTLQKHNKQQTKPSPLFLSFLDKSLPPPPWVSTQPPKLRVSHTFLPPHSNHDSQTILVHRPYHVAQRGLGDTQLLPE
jgi:hypothetical protein